MLTWKEIASIQSLKPIPKPISRQVLCRCCKRATRHILYTDDPIEHPPLLEPCNDPETEEERLRRENLFDRMINSLKRRRRVWCRRHAEAFFG